MLDIVKGGENFGVDIVLSGEGAKWFADSSTVQGVFLDGKLIKGSVRQANGVVAAGTWVDDYLHEGRITFPDGMIEELGLFAQTKLVEGSRT